MKKLSLFLILTLFGITAIAEAIEPKDTSLVMTEAPNLNKRTSGNYDIVGPQHNARLAIAPYAQVVPNASYTFIGVTHPSLSTAHTSIGLVVEAMDMTHPTQQAGNGVSVGMQRAAVFTIDAGQTHRIFIVNEGHAIINSLNKSINNANTHIITTKSDESQFGNIRVTAVGTEPNRKTGDQHRTGGLYAQPFSQNDGFKNGTQRFDNLNQLTMWGVVYQESNGAGFSLEFIGDMHDSSAAGTSTFGDKDHLGAGADTTANFAGAWIHPHRAGGYKQIGPLERGSAGVGRGLN